MSETVLDLIKIGIRLTTILAGVFAFIGVITIATSYVTVTTNSGVIGDVFAIVQMWLPFNLSAIFLWVITACTAYIAYGLTVIGINYMSKITGE